MISRAYAVRHTRTVPVMGLRGILLPSLEQLPYSQIVRRYLWCTRAFASVRDSGGLNPTPTD